MPPKCHHIKPAVFNRPCVLIFVCLETVVSLINYLLLKTRDIIHPGDIVVITDLGLFFRVLDICFPIVCAARGCVGGTSV